MPRKLLEDGTPVAPPKPGYGKMSSGCRGNEEGKKKYVELLFGGYQVGMTLPMKIKN